ncbi:Uncharacterised protein [uncultured Blautia sp.]|nr:Uncharacterised protein [uncultured Blautia sp.]
MGGVRLQGTAGSAVRLHQNVVELLRQHRHGRLWGRQLTRSRFVCPGTQQLMRPAQFVQLRRCPGAGQVRKRENLGGGAQQDRMLSGQLLAQGPQESGLSPAADDGSDTGTDIQQLGKGHGAFSLYRSSFHRIAPPPFLVKQVRRDCLFFRLLAVCNCQLPNFQVPLVDFCPLSHYTGTTKEGAV